MYSIRTFTADGVERNEILGSSYQVFKYNSKSKVEGDSFRAEYRNLFGKDYGDEVPEVKVLIIGDVIRCLYTADIAYIMNSEGKTFSKISYFGNKNG